MDPAIEKSTERQCALDVAKAAFFAAIGCVKGGEGYYRAIREDFPEQFEELCKVQDELGPGSYVHRNRTTNERFSLRDLGEGPVRRNEKLPACSFFCELAEADIIASE